MSYKKSRSGIRRSRTTDPATLVYKEFDALPLDSGKARDTWDYGADDSATTKWFEDNTNFKEILTSTELADRIALREYTVGHFMLGQQYRGFSSMTP